MSNKNLELEFFVKFGELSLKGKNRNIFVKSLADNIRRALSSFACALRVSYDYIAVDNFRISEVAEITSILKKIPGISVFYFGYRIPRKISLLQRCVSEHLPDTGTFKLVCRRKDKKYELNSLQIINKVAGYVLSSRPSLKVDLHNPAHVLTIEVHAN